MSLTIHTIPMRMSIAYLIESDAGLVLVDAGLRGEEKKVLERMRALDRGDLRLIFITHAHLDHYGSAGALRRITGAPIAVHHQDEEAMALGETLLGTARNMGRAVAAILPFVHPLLRPEPVQADIILEGDDHLGIFGLDAVALHTPGHTAGSSCLLVEDQLAFTGDLVTNTAGPQLQRFFAQDWSQLSKSLAKLQAKAPARVYPGHGRNPLTASELQSIGSPFIPG